MKRLIQGMCAAGVLLTPAIAAADPGDLVGIDIASVDLDGDMEGDNIYGYWEYLPTAYDTIGEPWPMFIFLSGTGENGNGVLPPGGCIGPGHPGSYLCRNLRHGPQAHIWNNLYGDGSWSEWDEEERPFIMISPQNPLPNGTQQNPTGPYDPDEIDDFLDFLIEHYNVDPRRIYLTGMSMGGYSVTLNAVNYSGRFAALAPLPGIGPGGVSDPCQVGRSALWAFHGEVDQAGGGAFDAAQMTSWIASVDACPEPHPDVRLTMYVGAGHNVWTRTIDPSQGQLSAVFEEFDYAGGSQTFDTVAYDPDLYTWLLQHDLPEVSAGPDLTATTDDESVDIFAFITDDDPVAFTWTQTGGDPLTLTGADNQTLTVSDLVEGEYTFHVFALDADDQWDEDDVTLTVVPGMGGGSESEGETGNETEGETSSTSTGGETESTTGGETGSSTGGETGSTSTAGSSTSAGETDSGSDSNGGSGTTTGDNGTTSGSASASGSDSSASETATATAGEGSSGADTDTDSDGGGSADDDGGCNVGGGTTPSLWMLGLFGLATIRRRR